MMKIDMKKIDDFGIEGKVLFFLPKECEEYGIVFIYVNQNGIPFADSILNEALEEQLITLIYTAPHFFIEEATKEDFRIVKNYMKELHGNEKN